MIKRKKRMGIGIMEVTVRMVRITCQDLVWVHDIPNVPISPQPWVPPHTTPFFTKNIHFKIRPQIFKEKKEKKR